MNTTRKVVEQWLGDARLKARNGDVDEADLDALMRIVQQPRRVLRQRLLYLHTQDTTVSSTVIAFDLREPTRDAQPTRLCPQPQMPYNTIHDAIVDGWRVVHFPHQAAPFDDRELAIPGYQFILEKLEEYDD